MAKPFTRMCVSCRSRRPQRELLRIVKDGSQIVLDADFCLPGRGFYLCREPACIDRARKARVFERTLSVQPEIDFYDKLKDLVQRNG